MPVNVFEPVGLFRRFLWIHEKKSRTEFCLMKLGPKPKLTWDQRRDAIDWRDRGEETLAGRPISTLTAWHGSAPRSNALDEGSVMDLRFEWQKPVRLTRRRKIIDPNNDIYEIEDVPGIYYFARNHGDRSFPFYVGETLKLRSRLKQHLAAAKICDILRGMAVTGAPAISGGPRSFHYAYFCPKSGQRAKPCLAIAQRIVIREAIAQDIPIVNSKLTVIKTHMLALDGNVEHRGGFLEPKIWVSAT